MSWHRPRAYATLARVRRPAMGRLNSGVRPRMRQFWKVSLAFTVGWITAMCVSLCCSLALWPHHLRRILLYDFAYLALHGALYGAAVPLVVTCLLSLRRPLSPLSAMLVSAAAALPYILWRFYRVWDYYGALPTWMPQQYLLVLLPAALAAGYMFALVLRRLAGPNNSFKPTPHRGAGHVPTLR